MKYENLLHHYQEMLQELFQDQNLNQVAEAPGINSEMPGLTKEEFHQYFQDILESAKTDGLSEVLFWKIVQQLSPERLEELRKKIIKREAA
jgi:hypothetical protein